MSKLVPVADGSNSGRNILYDSAVQLDARHMVPEAHESVCPCPKICVYVLLIFKTKAAYLAHKRKLYEN